MNTHKKIASALAAVVGLGATVIGATPVMAQTPAPPGSPAPPTNGPGKHNGERHPELRRALRSLERTETQLRNSARDFGGHRAKAADLCRQAEQEVQLALQYDNQ